MIDIIPREKRFTADYGWLKTHWLFSFSEYYDPENINFGNLRVFNDDIIASGGGFPEHFHQHMEIVTIVLSGEITHADSLGNQAVIKAGEVQRMSAGSGVRHSEFNQGKVPLHLYQIWFHPDSHGAAGYEQKSFSLDKNKLTLLVSKNGELGSVKINANSLIFQAHLEKGKKVERGLSEKRGLFVYVSEGAILVNEQLVRMGDQARIFGEKKVFLEATLKSLVTLIEVQFD